MLLLLLLLLCWLVLPSSVVLWLPTAASSSMHCPCMPLPHATPACILDPCRYACSDLLVGLPAGFDSQKAATLPNDYYELANEVRWKQLVKDAGAQADAGLARLQARQQGGGGGAGAGAGAAAAGAAGQAGGAGQQQQQQQVQQQQQAAGAGRRLAGLEGGIDGDAALGAALLGEEGSSEQQQQQQQQQQPGMYGRRRQQQQ